VRCEQPSITSAYHVVCNKCATTAGVCAKCLQIKAIVERVITPAEKLQAENLLREQLATMSERSRRTFLRRREIDPSYLPGAPWDDADDEEEDSMHEQPTKASEEHNENDDAEEDVSIPFESEESSS